MDDDINAGRIYPVTAHLDSIGSGDRGANEPPHGDERTQMTIDSEKLEDIRRLSSPVRMALAVVITVMLVEAVIMAVLHRIHGLSPWMETVIDSVALGCIVTLVLYVTIVRPLRTLLVEYHQFQSRLEDTKQELEREVRRQTDELHKANLLLQADVRIRSVNTDLRAPLGLA